MLYRSTLRAATRLAFSPTTRAFSTTPRAALARMTLIGRLASEPELVQTSTGREMVRYVVGVSSGSREHPITSWYRVACFDEGGKRDYLLGLPKGTMLHCDAQATMGTYDDPTDGKKRSALNLVQRSVEVLIRPKPQAQEAEAEPVAATA